MAKPDDLRSRAAGRGGMEPVDLPFVPAAALAAVVAQPGGAVEDGQPAIEAEAARRHAEREVAELLASGLAVARTESGAVRLVAVATDEPVALVAAVADEMGHTARLARGSYRGFLQIRDFDGMTSDVLRRSWFLQAPLLRWGGNNGLYPVSRELAFSPGLPRLYERISDMRQEVHEQYCGEVEARYWAWFRWQMFGLISELCRVLPLHAVVPICVYALPRSLPILFTPPLLQRPPHVLLPGFMAVEAPWTPRCDAYEAQCERDCRSDLDRLRGFKDLLRRRGLCRKWFSVHPARTRVFHKFPPGVEAQFWSAAAVDVEDHSVSCSEPRGLTCSCGDSSGVRWRVHRSREHPHAIHCFPPGMANVTPRMGSFPDIS